MFNKPSTAVNVITAVAAVFLSLFLVLLLPLTMVYSVAVDSITPQSIGKMTRATIDTMVESADFEQMILDNAVVQENIEALSLSTEAVGKLLQSEAADEIIAMLSADMAGLLTNEATEIRTTPEALVAVVKEHADELAQLAIDVTGETAKKETIKAEIIAAVEKDADGFVAILPNMTELRETVSQQVPLQTVSTLLNPLYLWIGIGVSVLLAGLIYLCRYYRFGGFLWLGIDGVLCAALLSLSGFGLRMIGDVTLATLPDGTAGVLGTIITHTLHSLNVRMWIVLGISIACIAAYILLYTLVAKKKLAAAQTPVMDVTPAAEEPVAITEE